MIGVSLTRGGKAAPGGRPASSASRSNLCLDVGWGKDGSTAVYFAVQEAF